MNKAFGNADGSGAALGLIIAIFLVARKDKQQTTIAKLALAPISGNLIGYLCVVVFKTIPPPAISVGWTRLVPV